MLSRSFLRGLGVVSCTLIALGGFSAAMAQDKPHEKPAPEKKDQEHKNGKKEATEGAKEKDKAKEAVKTEKNVVETATADKNLSTLCELLKEAGLIETLNGDGPFTVFAPTNDAFEKLGKETLDNLKKDKAKLASVLKYHVHAGKLTAAEVEKAKTIKTLNGAELTVTVKEKEITVDKSKISKTDIKCKNGVIHLIDAVAMPAEKKPEAKPKG